VGKLVNQVIGKETFSLWLKGEELPYEKSNLEIEPRDSKKIIYSHKVSKETSRQIWIEIDYFRKSIQEQNLGRIVFSPYIKLLRRISTGANWHPLGSMRMHASEAAVLNADLSFKFDRRVFCLDSSSFSTGAHHNPTAMSLTLTTLAVTNFLNCKSGKC